MLAKKYHHDFANLSGCVEDTLVDPDVRDAWRVMPNRIHIENPRWHSALQRVVEAACEKLSAADDTEVTLRNLLISLECVGIFKGVPAAIAPESDFVCFMCSPCDESKEGLRM